MKKLIFIIGLFSVAYAQTNCTQPAKNYVDTYIVPNGNNAITGQKANTAFNLIIKAINCNDSISKTVRKVDTIYKNSTKDSIVFLINGIRYAIKDSIGTGGGGSNNIYKNGLTKSNDTVYGGGQITDLSYSNSTDLLFNLDSTGQLYLPKIDTYTPSSEILIDSFPSATRNTLLDTFVNLFFSGNYTKLCFGDSTGTADKIKYRDYDKLILDTFNFPACTPGQELFSMLQFKFSNAIIPNGYYVDSFTVMFSGYDTLNCGGNINLGSVESPYWCIHNGNNFIQPDNFSYFIEKLDNPLIISGPDTIGFMNAHFDTATTNIDSLVVTVLMPLWQDYKGLYDNIYISYKLNPVVNNLVTIGGKVLKADYQAPLEADNGIGIHLGRIGLGNLTKNTLINGNGYNYQMYNVNYYTLGATGISIESNNDNISITAAEGKDLRLFAGESQNGSIEFYKNNSDGIFFKNLAINNSAQYVLGTNSITAAGGNVDWLEISTLGGQNFANANLTFDANRSHNLNGYNLNLFGGNIEIQGTDTTTIDSGSPSSYFNAQNNVDKPALSFFANNNGAVQPAMIIGASNSGGGADVYVLANKINWLSLSTDDSPNKLFTEGSDGYMKKTSVDSLDYVPITGTHTNKEITGGFFFKNGALADRGYIGYSTSQGLTLGAPYDGIVDEETFLRIKSTHFYLLHTDNNSGYDYGVRSDNNGVRVDGSPTGVGAYGQYDFSAQADSLELVQACFVKKYVDSLSREFPKGIEFVSVSRDWQSLDKDKLIILDAPNITITMPIINPFKDGDNVGVSATYSGSGFQTENLGDTIYPLTDAPEEIVKLANIDILGNILMLGVNTKFMKTFWGVSKTVAKYFYDESKLSGSFTATGTATTVFTVTIPTQANTTYKVFTEAKNLLSAPVRFVNNQTTTSFDVNYITGLTGAVAFDWFLKP